MGYKDNEKISLSIARVNECIHSLTRVEYLDFYRDIYDDYILDSKLEKYYPAQLSFACGAQCKDSYVIGPEGDVYKCWEQVGLEEVSIGKIDSIDDTCEQSTQYLNDIWPTTCDKCEYLPLCHGGCPKERKSNENKPICFPQTKTLNKYLEKYYELWKTENEE